MLIKKIFSFFILSFFISGCMKPNPHPKYPDYKINKPRKKYSANKKNLSKLVKKLEGKPYVWAAEGPSEFDCSGYTYYMYGSMGIDIPRVAREQAKKGKLIKFKDLKYGDLIFFDTTKRRTGKITHVGMYLGNGWFTHASTKTYKVTYSRLNKKYYKTRIKVCRRYLKNENKFNNYSVWKTSKNIIQNKKNKHLSMIQSDFKKEKVSHSRKHKLISLNGSYIQVGSYINKPNKNIILKIESLNLPYEIIKFPRNGKYINKLLIGPYSSSKKATNVLKKVRKSINKNAFLVKID